MASVSNQSPAPGSNIRPTDIITFTVTGADPYGLALYYPDGTYEILWDGTVFAPFYMLNSSRSGGPMTWSFSILRTGGWKQAPTVTFMANASFAFNAAAPLSVSGNPAVLSISAASSSAAGSMSAADKAFEDSLHAATVNLTDADATLLWSTSPSYNMPANTQTALRTLTIGVSDSPPSGAIMRIGVFFQSAALTRITNGGPGGGTTNNLQGAQATYWYRFDGTNWGLYFPQGLYPLASATYSGLLSSAQFGLLNGATAAATASTLCERDSSGNCAFTNVSLTNLYLSAGSYGTSTPSITTPVSAGGQSLSIQASPGTGAQIGGNVAIVAGNGGDSSHTGGGVTLDVGAVASATGASAKLSIQQNATEWLSWQLASSASTVSQFGQGTPKINAEVDTVQTTNATVTTVSTYAMPDNTLVDFSVTIAARNNSNNGDAYRGDLFFTYQRFGGAAPSLVGAAPSVQNARTNGGGSGYAISVTTSGNNVLVQVTGVAATTINWSSALQAQVR